MKLPTPPEIADGGYWYVVPEANAADGSRVPEGVFTSGWCAWYVGGFAVVRTAEPTQSVAAVVRVGDVLTGPKPFGRIRGA